ncbi:MAG: hypothetical protein H0X66_16275 [Verrucomicrobia bacterium]|nr:hypothetical protein [Verrucomicrobiota bacterium]
MKLNADVSEVPWKKVVLVAAVLLIVGGAAFGGWIAYNKAPSHPLTPEGNKTLVQRYLKQRAERNEFKPVMEVASDKNPWNLLKVQYDQPPDYKTVYRNIGEHLMIAEHLLSQSEARQQANGMRIASELCDIAVDVAVDPWLAARICDAYIMPNLDKIEEKPKNGPSREQYMNIAAKIYRVAEEKERQIELGKAYLAQATPGQRADQARWRLARTLEQNGDKKEALKYFQEITHPSLTNDVTRRIATLEKSLQTAKQ